MDEEPRPPWRISAAWEEVILDPPPGWEYSIPARVWFGTAGDGVEPTDVGREGTTGRGQTERGTEFGVRTSGGREQDGRREPTPIRNRAAVRRWQAQRDRIEADGVGPEDGGHRGTRIWVGSPDREPTDRAGLGAIRRGETAIPWRDPQVRRGHLDGRPGARIWVGPPDRLPPDRGEWTEDGLRAAGWEPVGWTIHGDGTVSGVDRSGPPDEWRAASRVDWPDDQPRPWPRRLDVAGYRIGPPDGHRQPTREWSWGRDRPGSRRRFGVSWEWTRSGWWPRFRDWATRWRSWERIGREGTAGRWASGERPGHGGVTAYIPVEFREEPAGGGSGAAERPELDGPEPSGGDPEGRFGRGPGTARRPVRQRPACRYRLVWRSGRGGGRGQAPELARWKTRGPQHAPDPGDAPTRRSWTRPRRARFGNGRRTVAGWRLVEVASTTSGRVWVADDGTWWTLRPTLARRAAGPALRLGFAVLRRAGGRGTVARWQAWARYRNYRRRVVGAVTDLDGTPPSDPASAALYWPDRTAEWVRSYRWPQHVVRPSFVWARRHPRVFRWAPRWWAWTLDRTGRRPLCRATSGTERPSGAAAAVGTVEGHGDDPSHPAERVERARFWWWATWDRREWLGHLAWMVATARLPARGAWAQWTNNPAQDWHGATIRGSYPRHRLYAAPSAAGPRVELDPVAAGWAWWDLVASGGCRAGDYPTAASGGGHVAGADQASRAEGSAGCRG